MFIITGRFAEFQSALRFAVVSDVLVNGIMFVTFGFQSASRFAVLPEEISAMP